MSLLNWVFTILSFQFSNHVFHSKTSFTIPDMKWVSSTYEKNKLVPSILQVYHYLELILEGEARYGRERRCSWENGGGGGGSEWECGTSRQPCAAFLHNPTKLCYFRFPIQNGPRFERAKNNETKENTHPILTFWIGPFGLYFLFPHLISDHVMLPQKTVSFKFRPIHVYMHVQF